MTDERASDFPARASGRRDSAGPKRLLILDDEAALLRPLARYFGSHGYAVSACQEPEEAEALLEFEAFDLVIVDLALTRFGREGLEVLGSIRARHRWLPVIVFSANVCPDVHEAALRLGADAVLSKPQPLAALVQVADRLVGKP